MASSTAQVSEHVVAITALGVPIDIEVAGEQVDEMVAAIRRAWSGARRIDGVARRTVTISEGDPEFVLHHLSQLVTQVAIEARAGELMMFHAAGLAHPTTGRTIALVAPSGTGKTTICRTLGREWAYVSDETVGLDSDLAVAAYRKPLSVVQASTNIKVQTSPDVAGLVATPEPLTLAAVVLLERDESVKRVEVDAIRTVAALPLLAEQTSYLGRHRRPLQSLAHILEATGGLRIVRYRAAEDLGPLAEEMMGSAS